MNTVTQIAFWFGDANERGYSKAQDCLDTTAGYSYKLSLLKILYFVSCPLNVKCQQLGHKNKLLLTLYNRFSR
jgi:hypothetical protein